MIPCISKTALALEADMPSAFPCVTAVVREMYNALPVAGKAIATTQPSFCLLEDLARVQVRMSHPDVALAWQSLTLLIKRGAQGR